MRVISYFTGRSSMEMIGPHKKSRSLEVKGQASSDSFKAVSIQSTPLAQT